MNIDMHQKKRKHSYCNTNESSNLNDVLETDSIEKNEKKKRKKNKKKKHKKNKESSDNIITPNIDSSETTPASADDTNHPIIMYPYTIRDDDHCETPLVAYEDIAPLLQAIATSLGKSRSTLRIYDPYYCEGSVVANLASLGFLQVYNRLEDFYAKIDSNSVPVYDVLVTNPPYSGDNMPRLLNFCVQSNKPWFLLLPNYVYTKDYYLRTFPRTDAKVNRPSHSFSKSSSSSSAVALTPDRTDTLFYIAPKHRYQYLTPKGRRQQKSAKLTSPFPTFWYCSGSTLLPRRTVHSLCDTRTRVDVSLGTPSALPLVTLPDSDPHKKKLRNAEKRKKHKNRKKEI
jgi:hypothetical protein